MSIDSAFDRIEVLFPAGTNQGAVDDYISLLRSVRFRKFINVNPHYYESLASTEARLATDLNRSVFDSHLVLKYPNPLVGKPVANVTSILNRWSRAIFQTVPADYDVVYAVPEEQAGGQEMIPCPAYVLTSDGAAKFTTGLQLSPITAYQLDFD